MAQGMAIVTRTVTHHDKTVVILARRIRSGGWRLRIQGRCRQYFTDWILPFDSGTQAVGAALRAIGQEGIDSFYEPGHRD